MEKSLKSEGRRGRAMAKVVSASERIQEGEPTDTPVLQRAWVEDLLEDYFSSPLFADDLASLPPKERMNMYVKLMQYARPKVRAVEAEPAQSVQSEPLRLVFGLLQAEGMRQRAATDGTAE